MTILCFFLKGTAHLFDAICLLLASLLIVTNGFLRLDNGANLLEVVVSGLICQVNEFMGLEEFLVRLFAIVFHLWLKYHNHSNHSTYLFSLVWYLHLLEEV